MAADPRFLIVRLGALGDLVHAIPVAAALRAAFPGCRLDWLARARHRGILDLVPVVDRRLYLGATGAGIRSDVLHTGMRHFGSDPTCCTTYPGASGLARAVTALRRARYDAALDLQGLGKSALLARLSGARRVIGFPRGHLREAWARACYSETCDPGDAVHVVDKNLAFARAAGAREPGRTFPLRVPPCAVVDEARSRLGLSGPAPMALLNPGAGWPNKRWPADRFGALASELRARWRLSSLVLWGPREQALAQAVASASGGAAVAAPPTGVVELIHLCRAAALLVSGDTGPLHIAAACGTPIVGIYGPTNPARNGPFDPADRALSRFDACVCHHKRRCRRPVPCVEDIGVDELLAAAGQRLAAAGRGRGDA